jgi:hypothetical protein
MLSFLRRKGEERSSVSKKSGETSFRVHDLCTTLTKKKNTVVQSPSSTPCNFRRKQNRQFAKGNVSINNDNPTVDLVQTPSCSFGDAETHEEDAQNALPLEKDSPTLLAPRDFPSMDAYGSSFGSLDSSSSSGLCGDIDLNQLEERIFRTN